jgi:hypothetical protein
MYLTISFLDPDELERNKKSLIKKLTAIIDRITSKEGIDRMPTGIRVIAGNIAEFAKKYLPNREKHLVANFIFGRLESMVFANSFACRYLNAAILSPESYGITPKGKVVTAETKRNLTLISRVLQV